MSLLKLRLCTADYPLRATAKGAPSSRGCPEKPWAISTSTSHSCPVQPLMPRTAINATNSHGWPEQPVMSLVASDAPCNQRCPNSHAAMPKTASDMPRTASDAPKRRRCSEQPTMPRTASDAPNRITCHPLVSTIGKHNGQLTHLTVCLEQANDESETKVHYRESNCRE